jgi:hypothetical protein
MCKKGYFMEQRKIAFDSISRFLAITRYDIEQHQHINDQSLNIHGENWFRDIFNFVYDLKLINANFLSSNYPAIDLVDNTNNIVYQITTTRTKEKVEHTLTKIAETIYKDFSLKIFFLLEKAKFQKETRDYFSNKYGINISDILKDYNDLIKDIESLETDKLIELNKRFFSFDTTRYTDEIILDLIFKHLLKKQKEVKKDFYEDFGNIDINQKIELNSINERISSEIKKGADYRAIIDNFCNEDNMLEDLRDYIINNLYRNILIESLLSKKSRNELNLKQTSELQDLASNYQIDFNMLIKKLHEKIENSIEIQDFNTMNIGWIIVSYFFEICDVGVDEK